MKKMLHSASITLPQL